MASLSFTAKDVPQIKDWKVGNKYKFVVEVEMKSIAEHDEWWEEGSMKRLKKPRKVTSARFDITKAKVVDDKDAMKMSKGKFKDMRSKALAGELVDESYDD